VRLFTAGFICDVAGANIAPKFVNSNIKKKKLLA
jgi:hypothetical protein